MERRAPRPSRLGPGLVPPGLGRPALHQQSDNIHISQGRLMQRRRVGVVSLRIEPVRIFARIEEQADDFHVPMLRGEC